MKQPVKGVFRTRSKFEMKTFMKKLSTSSGELFSQKVSPQMFNWPLNVPSATI